MSKEVYGAVSQYRYVLEVIQQPKRARAMAFGDRDRRPVDPCPIIQLKVLGPDGAENKQLVWNNPLIMHVTLFDKTGKAECSVAYSTYDTPMVPADNAQPAAETQASTKAQQMQKGPTMDETTPKAWPMSDTKLNTATSPQPLPLLPPLQQQPQSIALPPYSSCAERDSRYAEQLFQEQTDSEQAATGSLVSAPFYLRDLDDRPGCFFCFPDIRIRYPGKYSLRFALMRLPSTEPVTTKPEHILECVFSTAFTVYSIKDFPGVDESTALSKKFAQQGVGIPIRNKGRLKPETGEDPVLD